MNESFNTTIAALKNKKPFFQESCLYVEVDYINHPGLIQAMLLAGMPDGSRLVVKFPESDTREVLAFWTQAMYVQMLEESATMYIETDKVPQQ